MTTFKLELDIPNIDEEQAEEILTFVSDYLSEQGLFGLGGIFEQESDEE